MNTVLWIKNAENWGMFMMSRVQEIKAHSNRENWKFVPGDINPADILSRVWSVETLKNKK